MYDEQHVELKRLAQTVLYIILALSKTVHRRNNVESCCLVKS